MIRLDNVSFWYSLKAPILKDFSLTFDENDRVCLSGRSGIGKTTVLRLIMGLEKPRRGTVSLPEGLSVSAVFQEDRLIPWKTALENAALFANEETARRLLHDLGLGEAEDLLPDELSGGMRRRVALARALAHPFSLLILDEPFTGLDAETKALCLRVTANEMAALGRMLVLATHNLEEAAVLGARIIDL